MLPPATKRQILSFSDPKTQNRETEAAAVFAVAELNRSKGGGIFNRQPTETLQFITKIGYPLWVYSKNGGPTLVFDGLNCYSHSVSYLEGASASAFMERLQTYQRPREAYLSFLCDHNIYFQQPPQTKQFTFNGLIEDAEFRNDFSLYRREATDLTQTDILLLPLLSEQNIQSNYKELDNLLANMASDNTKLDEAQKLIKKTTSQYQTEIEFQATAAKDEADAKIKATQEFVNPEITKITREFNRRAKDLTAEFDDQLEDLEKQKRKIEKSIFSSEADIREYERNAKDAGKKGHEVYEKRWKEKAKTAEKELSGYKKDLKNLESTVNKLIRQKASGLSNLNLELESAIKRQKQPLLDLEAARDEKIFAFKQESNRLAACERPVVEGIDSSLKLRESVSKAFNGLTVDEQQIKDAALVYVPFYVVCYESGSGRRYMCIPPATIGEFDFSAKIRDALGAGKSKSMLTPRFAAISEVISKAKALAAENTTFEAQLISLGGANNLLSNSTFCQDAKNGIAVLQKSGWLSEREASELSRQLTA